MSGQIEHRASPVHNRPRITFLPSTDHGRWAVALGVAFSVLVFAGSVLPRGGALGVVLGFVCALAGGALRWRRSSATASVP